MDIFNLIMTVGSYPIAIFICTWAATTNNSSIGFRIVMGFIATTILIIDGIVLELVVSLKDISLLVFLVCILLLLLLFMFIKHRAITIPLSCWIVGSLIIGFFSRDLLVSALSFQASVTPIISPVYMTPTSALGAPTPPLASFAPYTSNIDASDMIAAYGFYCAGNTNTSPVNESRNPRVSYPPPGATPQPFTGQHNIRSEVYVVGEKDVYLLLERRSPSAMFMGLEGYRVCWFWALKANVQPLPASHELADVQCTTGCP